MTAFTIQDVSRRSGLSEPTLRYEEVGLIGSVDRDASSGHRRYSGEDVDTLRYLLACVAGYAASTTCARTRPTGRADVRPRPSSATCCCAMPSTSSDRDVAHPPRLPARQGPRGRLPHRGDDGYEAAAWERTSRVERMEVALTFWFWSPAVRCCGHAADRGAAAGTGPRYGPRSGRSTARPGCARRCAVAALTTLAWRSWLRT